MTSTAVRCRLASCFGFDNWEVLQYVQPKLTTVAQDYEKKVECAVKLLLKRIRGEEISQTHVTLDVELIDRQSVRKLN
jgi:LacI family transcriptional regulator